MTTSRLVWYVALRRAYDVRDATYRSTVPANAKTTIGEDTDMSVKCCRLNGSHSSTEGRCSTWKKYEDPDVSSFRRRMFDIVLYVSSSVIPMYECTDMFDSSSKLRGQVMRVS
eukprot:4083673-Prymnesium_polylepis.1